MNRFVEKLLNPEPHQELIMGNYALVRAMLESGVKVATTYPGSPTPEIAAAIRAIPDEKRSLYFEYSVNEKVALEIALGASVNGHLSTVFFKSVGLNVAADSAVQLALMNVKGGMVIILGDDPGAHSSQNEQDNRHFARTSYIPMLEPATPTEAYKMYKEATKLSKKHQMPIFLRMTTHVCHANEVIEFDSLKIKDYNWKSDFDPEDGPYLPITKSVFPLKRNALKKLEFMQKESENSAFNKIHSPHGSGEVMGMKLGIISSSMPVLSILENLKNVEYPIDLLQINFSFPFPKRKVERFLDNHDEVLILEELDRVLEQELKNIAWDCNAQCKLLSRQYNNDLVGELTPGRTWKILSDTWPDLFPPKQKIHEEPDISPRIAQMCPGCGHRSAFHAIKKALPEGTITVGDIGCHSLGFFKPYNMGEILLSMGHSNGTGSGLSIRNNQQKVVTFIGDSTFFHAGIPGIINAQYHDHNITLVVMENGTTAMTGHQPHPGSGEISAKISIKKILESIGIEFIRDIDTYNQKKLTKYMQEALDHEGFSVVIARHPCMLKFTREQRRKESYNPSHVKINQEKCRQIYECVQEFACPSFAKLEGGKVVVNEELCIGDGSCLQTCPVNAIEFEKHGGNNG
ncbi:MAG: indolepyruvate ferredoxin oxidoreductase subunit alpha [Candidatus Marinimicrobia bacterium]|nr:indolepyruvate ferredoxin oxidoreductase subunit alpha [Candidatus Neomarinimicrobiota bacterium]